MATNMGDEVRRLREANKVQYVLMKENEKNMNMYHVFYVKYTKLLDLSVN